MKEPNEGWQQVLNIESPNILWSLWESVEVSRRACWLWCHGKIYRQGLGGDGPKQISRCYFEICTVRFTEHSGICLTKHGILSPIYEEIIWKSIEFSWQFKPSYSNLNKKWQLSSAAEITERTKLTRERPQVSINSKNHT